MDEIVNYVVAIPSYRRALLLMKRSMSMCIRWNIPFDRIHIFVVLDEYEVYKEMLKYYHGVKLVIGPVGLNHMRNFMTQYFPANTPILYMDDDIKDIYVLQIQDGFEDTDHKKYKLAPIPENVATKWIQDAFLYTKEQGGIMFGIYPVKNGYFMKDSPEITTKLSFCVGVFWGIWNRHDLHIHLEEKEDFERTLWCFEKCGKTIRYNWITPCTSYYKTPGGMQSRNTNRIESSKASCEYLLHKWPMWCKLYTSKKSGIHEVRLREAKQLRG